MAPCARGELVAQALRQPDGREEVHLEHLAPRLHRGVQRVEPGLAPSPRRRRRTRPAAHARADRALGRDAGVVHQRVELAAGQPLAHLAHRAQRVLRIGEVDLDVVLRPRGPRAILRERVPRAGDHAPARAREALDGRMPDAAACAGEDQRAAFFVRGGCGGHGARLEQIEGGWYDKQVVMARTAGHPGGFCTLFQITLRHRPACPADPIWRPARNWVTRIA